MVVLDTSSTWPLVSCSNKYFSSVQSSTCDDEYIPVDADASPLGVVTHDGWLGPAVVTDDGWLGPAVVADGGWLGPAAVADDGWLGPAVVTDDGWLGPAVVADGGWLGPADVSWLELVKVAG